MNKQSYNKMELPGIMVHAWNPSIQEAEARGLPWVRGQPQLHSEFKGSLKDLVRSYIEKKIFFKELLALQRTAISRTQLLSIPAKIYRL